MKILLMGLLSFMLTVELSAIETVKYEVLKTDGVFETRQYEAHILAEVEVSGTAKEAGNKAFGLLFKYISGANELESEISESPEMQQQKKSVKIAMTAPVNQEKNGEKWLVSFVMPSQYTLETLPKPTNNKVKLKQVEPRKMVAIRYSGTWSEKRYIAHKKKLEDWVSQESLESTGEAIWARYNSPFSLWFMRRNEVILPIK